MPDFNAILAALANLPPPLSSSVPLVPAPAPPINGGPAFPQTEQDIAVQSVAPTAPTEPLDQNLIRQIMALAPPAPTAPAPLSRGQRIANALIGFGAGVQGAGPQFLEQLQQPQRQYQQQLANYNNERSRLGLTALETAQNKQERAQAERQRRADIQAQRDFEVQLDKMKFTNETARDQARNAFLLELEARKEKQRLEQEAAKEKALSDRQKRNIEAELVTKDLLPSNIAKEKAAYIVDGTPMSAAAEKYISLRATKLQNEAAKLQVQIARIGAGGSGKQDTSVQLVDQQGNVIDVQPYSALKFQYGQVQGYPEGTTVRSPRAQAQQAAPAMPASPYFNMGGDTGMLSQGAQPQAPAVFSKAEVRDYARKNKKNPKDVEAAIKAKGGIVQ